MLGWLMGLVFPACAATGAAGLPPPAAIDFTALVRPATPNTALAASVGATPVVPDLALDALPAPAARVREAVRRAAEAEGAFAHGTTSAPDGTLQEHWVVRSKLLNFPDLVTAEVRPWGEATRLVLWSRSVYGHSDLGANKARLERWVGRIQAELAQ